MSGLLADFTTSLQGDDLLDRLRAGTIGEGAPVPGPFGMHPLVYADYAASGRALRQIEDFMLERVLPYYANSHTEASYCGEFITRLRRSGRALIARACGADSGFATIFAGSGATAGINRLVHLLGVSDAVARGEAPVIFIGPYEHHSNILPWRESGAEIVEIPESLDGGPDLEMLDKALTAAGPGRLRVGSFSAASNVTGIVSDVDAVSRILKRHGALSVWDYAGGGPYLDIAMRAGIDCEKDAVVISTHKFLGGPGASGILIVRKDAVRRTTPVLPGGGTVRFVSPWTHDYTSSLEAREEAGTPNVVGDIRAALCFAVKTVIGQETLDHSQASMRARALARWSGNAAIDIMGNRTAPALPIFSFRIRNSTKGGYIHQQLFTRMLSDYHGIQARGGCACAGPYAHRLLDIDEGASDMIRRAILAGEEMEKPGWTRVNFSVLADDAKVEKIITAIDELATNADTLARHYSCDPVTARFRVPDAA